MLHKIKKFVYFLPKLFFDFFSKNIGDNDNQAKSKTTFFISIFLMLALTTLNHILNFEIERKIGKGGVFLLIIILIFIVNTIIKVDILKSLNYKKIDYKILILIYLSPLFFFLLKIFYTIIFKYW